MQIWRIDSYFFLILMQLHVCRKPIYKKTQKHIAALSKLPWVLDIWAKFSNHLGPFPRIYLNYAVIVTSRNTEFIYTWVSLKSSDWIQQHKVSPTMPFGQGRLTEFTAVTTVSWHTGAYVGNFGRIASASIKAWVRFATIRSFMFRKVRKVIRLISNFQCILA